MTFSIKHFVNLKSSGALLRFDTFMDILEINQVRVKVVVRVIRVKPKASLLQTYAKNLVPPTPKYKCISFMYD